MVSICARVDGLPLAIELAVARLRSMSLTDLHGRLGQRFRLLTEGDRTALARQQTLQATVEWSYSLLTGAEQALLRRLPVFPETFDLAAAEAVCGVGDIKAFDVAGLLGSLVDKSLVVAEPTGPALRYRLVETIRQFAAERLAETGGDEAAVSCPTGSFCMAIGGSALSTPNPKPLAERWNGKTWTILPIPAPAGAQGVLIGPVSCTSPSACTTTGVSLDPSGVGTTVAERWNGRAWHIQVTPNPPGAQGAALMSVTCTGPSACLAVGAANPFTPNAKTLAERWNGVTWRIVQSPNPPGGGTFSAVSCVSPTACTGIGYSNAGTTLAERWNGTKWTIQPTPNPVAAFQVTLDSVACPARSSCTAVGDYGVNATGANG